MKVRLPKDYRERYTLKDVDRAKSVIAFLKEDDEKPDSYAEMAVREVLKDVKGGSLDTVITANAETAKNSGVYDVYGDGTENMDVLISFLAKCYFCDNDSCHCGFIEGEAYLSDIYQTGAVRYSDKVYYRVYREI